MNGIWFDLTLAFTKLSKRSMALLPCPMKSIASNHSTPIKDMFLFSYETADLFLMLQVFNKYSQNTDPIWLYPWIIHQNNLMSHFYIHSLYCDINQNKRNSIKLGHRHFIKHQNVHPGHLTSTHKTQKSSTP